MNLFGHGLAAKGIFLKSHGLGLGEVVTPPSVEINVSNNTELNAALDAATGGETIILAAGVNFGRMNRDGDTFIPAVTIRNQDDNVPAFFEEFDISNFRGYHFEGPIEFRYVDQTASVMERRYIIANGIDLSFDSTRHIGNDATNLVGNDPNNGAAGNGFPAGIGVAISDITGFTMRNCLFRNWWRSGAFTRITNFVINDNEVTDARSDGFVFQELRSGEFRRNYFHDFRTNPATADHVDFVQFFTIQTFNPSEFIELTDNIMDVGTGGNAQAFFLGSNSSPDAVPPVLWPRYQNLTFRNNIIRTGSTHGITVEYGFGNILVENNTIIETGADSVPFPVPPRINATAGTEGMTIRNNVCGAISATDGVDGNVVADTNVFAQRENRFLPNYIGDLFINGLSDNDSDIRQVRNFPAANAVNLGGNTVSIDTVGAPGNVLEALTPELTALAHIDQTGDLTFSFDAQYSRNASGPVPSATYTWDFGNGEPLENGVSISRTFDTHGEYLVSLTVDDGSSTDTQLMRVRIEDPFMFSMEADGASGSEMAVLEAFHTDPLPTVTGALFEQDGGQAVFRLQESVSTVLPREYTGGEARFGSQAKRRISWRMKGVAGDDGALFDKFSIFTCVVDASGNITFSTRNASDTFDAVTSSGVNFLDGEWHDVSAIWDIETGTFKLYDGLTEVGSTSITDLTGADQNRSMSFGQSSNNVPGATCLFDNFEWASDVVPVVTAPSQFIAYNSPVSATTPTVVIDEVSDVFGAGSPIIATSRADLISGAELETGSSFQPTASNEMFDGGETHFIEVRPTANDVANTRWISEFYNGANAGNENIQVFIQGGTFRVSFKVLEGGSNPNRVINTGVAANAGAANYIAIRLTATNVGVSVNGNPVVENTVVTALPTLTAGVFGQNDTGSVTPLEGGFNEFVRYPGGLSNAELVALSTVPAGNPLNSGPINSGPVN